MWWVVDGEKIRVARVKKSWSVRQLVRHSGVSERTIRRAENQSNKMRLSHDTVMSLSRALDLPLEDFARPCAVAATAGQAKKNVREPTELETYVELVAGLPPRPPVEHAGHTYETLGPRAFQNVMTAFVPYDGKRFALRGKVKTQAASTPAEADALSSRVGVASRFYVLCPVVKGKELRVTAYAARAEDTLSMQDAIGEEAVVLVRVVLAKEGAPGFSFFGLETPRPWAFVVEAVRR